MTLSGRLARCSRVCQLQYAGQPPTWTLHTLGVRANGVHHALPSLVLHPLPTRICIHIRICIHAPIHILVHIHIYNRILIKILTTINF